MAYKVFLIIVLLTFIFNCYCHDLRNRNTERDQMTENEGHSKQKPYNTRTESANHIRGNNRDYVAPETSQTKPRRYGGSLQNSSPPTGFTMKQININSQVENNFGSSVLNSYDSVPNIDPNDEVQNNINSNHGGDKTFRKPVENNNKLYDNSYLVHMNEGIYNNFDEVPRHLDATMDNLKIQLERIPYNYNPALVPVYYFGIAGPHQSNNDGSPEPNHLYTYGNVGRNRNKNFESRPAQSHNEEGIPAQNQQDIPARPAACGYNLNILQHNYNSTVLDFYPATPRNSVNFNLNRINEGSKVEGSILETSAATPNTGENIGKDNNNYGSPKQNNLYTNDNVGRYGNSNFKNRPVQSHYEGVIPVQHQYNGYGQKNVDDAIQSDFERYQPSNSAVNQSTTGPCSLTMSRLAPKATRRRGRSVGGTNNIKLISDFPK